MRSSPESRWKRWAYFLVGWLFFGLGVLGVFLPVLPTTPFMLLALWCFSQSSARFHHWLYHHRLFGPALQRWRDGRVIPLKAKVIALSTMAASLSYVTIFRHPPWYLLAIMASTMGYGAWFILRCPSQPPQPPEPSKEPTE